MLILYIVYSSYCFAGFDNHNSNLMLTCMLLLFKVVRGPKYQLHLDSQFEARHLPLVFLLMIDLIWCMTCNIQVFFSP